MIAFARVNIGTGGPVSCSLCASSATPRSPRPLADIETAIERIASSWSHGPGPNVAFVGFEPFAHPELPQLVDAASSRGFERIRLRTDGGALASPGNAEGVLGAGVRQLEIVAVGGSIAENDRLAGRQGLSEAARAGVGAYLAAAASRGATVDVGGYVPVCRHNASQLPQIVVRLAEIGAGALHLDACGLKDSDQHHAWLTAAVETATVNRLAAFVTGWARPLGRLSDAAPWRVIEEGE